MKYSIQLSQNGPDLFETVKMLERPVSQKWVNIKRDRNCSCCNRLLEKNSKVLTVSRKYEGRKWFCKICSVEFEPTEGTFLVGSFVLNYGPVFFSPDKTEWKTHLEINELDSFLFESYKSRLEEAIEESMPNEY